MNVTGHIRKRTSKAGKTIYQAVIELPPNKTTGKRNRKFHSFGEGITKKQAENALRKMLEEYSTGTYVERNNTTLGEWIDKWYSLFNKDLSPTTKRGYENQIKTYIKSQPIADMYIQDITTEDVQSWVNTISQSSPASNKPISGKTVKNVFLNLSAAMRKAVELEKIRKNPCDNVHLPKCKKHKIEIYSRDLIDEMLRLSEGTDIEVMIKLTLALGLRRGELCALKWNKFDFDNLTVTIDENNVYVDKSISEDGFITKSPKSESGNRILSVSPSLVDFLVEYGFGNVKNWKGFGDKRCILCHRNGKPYTPGAISRKFSRFLKKNNLPHMRFHDLRHINATLMLQEGVSPKVAQARLGHSTTAITLDVYSHVTESMQKDCAEKVDSIVFQTHDADVTP